MAAAVTTNLSMIEKINSIESTIQIDPGQRGIATFTPPPGELLRAAESLIRLKGTSASAAIITGFPCLIDFNPPTETDGPLGAVAIARAFLEATAAAPGSNSPEPKLLLLTDECNEAVLRATIESAGISDHARFQFEAFPATPDWSEEKDSKRLNDIAQEISTCVAIERCGPGADGKYYTMNAFDMTHIVGPLHRLMVASETPKTDKPLFQSVGIGDGGNEVGMGKVFDQIQQSTVKHKEKVACVVSADHLIVCGVSNWGGNALGAAVTLLASSGNQAEDKTLWDKCMPTDENDQAILDAMVAAGCRDGCSKALESTVDGMPFERSLDITRKIREIATTQNV